MQKTILCLAIICTVFSISQAQKFEVNHLYPIETSHSFVNFEITYMGYAKFRGLFEEFYGSIYYNPEDLSQTSVSFQIKVASIDTNSDWRDNDLKSDNWFLAEKFPHIRFVSTKAEKKGKMIKVTGDLTIKEKTKKITLMVSPSDGVIKDIRDDHQVIFTGEYELSRKEFGVLGSNWSQERDGITALSDEVTIQFSLIGKQLKKNNFSNFVRNENRPHGSIYAAYKKGGTAEAFKRYETLKADEEQQISSSALNIVAYMLMKEDKLEDAKSLMLRNLEDFPEDPNVYDSLGELQAKMGNLKEAKTNYQKSLDMDPDNLNALEALKHL